MAKCITPCPICKSENTRCFAEADNSDGNGPYDKFTILCLACGFDDFVLRKTSGLGTTCPYCGQSHKAK